MGGVTGIQPGTARRAHAHGRRGGGSAGGRSADAAQERDPDERGSTGRGSTAGVASAGDPAGTSEGSDRLEALGEEIAALATHIHAATQQLLALLVRFDRLEGWKAAGHRSCAHWLSYRSGMDLHTAREHVRVARALAELPRTSASMARGRLSFSKVRAITRVATAESESRLLALAEDSTTAQVERTCRAWKRGSRRCEADRERERHRLRTLSVFPDDEGMYLIRGRLEPEVGTLLMRAIDAASDALYRERREPGRPGAPRPEPDRPATRGPEAASPARSDIGDVPAGTRSAPVDSSREAARRRHDALALLAECALAAGFGPGSTACESAPISGTRAARYQVLLHVDPDTLSEDREPGRSDLEDGTRVAAGTARRLACDAAVVRVQHDADGAVLDVGRRTRTIPPALRRALEVRDGGCCFPGCGLRFTDAHHVIHWADGGETSLENTLLLCRFHHRLVHEGGWRLEWSGSGRPEFRKPGRRALLGDPGARAASRAPGAAASRVPVPTPRSPPVSYP